MIKLIILLQREVCPMVQEITTKSWGSRIMGAFGGIIIGIVLIIGAFMLIFWNEGHGLHVKQALKQTQQRLIMVPNAPVNPKNNLRVIYFNGVATTNNILQDPSLGISLKALKLKRKVEMYQWQEHSETRTEKQFGGSEKQIRTYSYKPTWSENVIISSQFKDPASHQNPNTMPIHSLSQQASQVTVGDFYLSPDLITDISGFTGITLTQTNADTLTQVVAKTAIPYDNGLYVGQNPQSPQIGDLRIFLSAVPPQMVSVIAQQTGNTLQPFLAPAGQPVSLLAMGKLSPDLIIREAEASNKQTTWLLRLVSLAMMIFGIGLLMKPLSVLADVIPFFGSIVEFGTGVIAFVGGLILWSTATAIAWFAVRPGLAIGLIVLVIALIAGLVILKKRRVKASS